MPTEAEWERAAAYPPSYVDNNTRARRREYPWGNNAVTTIRGRIPASIKANIREQIPTSIPANIRESNIGGTSVVGIFPHGAGMCGAEDLVGNAWEWCSTPHIDYPFENEVRAENLFVGSTNAIIPFVLRGGSWGYDYICCTYRATRRPGADIGHDICGLRLARLFL